MHTGDGRLRIRTTCLLAMFRKHADDPRKNLYFQQIPILPRL